MGTRRMTIYSNRENSEKKRRWRALLTMILDDRHNMGLLLVNRVWIK